MMQALLDSPSAAHDARTHARGDCAASPEPPPAVTPMTRGADTVARRSDAADAHYGREGTKASPAPPAADVSPKVSVSPRAAVPDPALLAPSCLDHSLWGFLGA